VRAVEVAAEAGDDGEGEVRGVAAAGLVALPEEIHLVTAVLDQHAASGQLDQELGRTPGVVVSGQRGFERPTLFPGHPQEGSAHAVEDVGAVPALHPDVVRRFLHGTPAASAIRYVPRRSGIGSPSPRASASPADSCPGDTTRWCSSPGPW